MTVKKPVPCSLYDIRGMQEWLDEMALQGLFLAEFSTHYDRATFHMDDPRPVRYRLDPIRKAHAEEQDQENPYAEMGWEFVCSLARSFYVYSCGDPEAPELYTDPQSLAIALDGLVKREVRNTILIIPFVLAIGALILFTDRHYFLRELLLWERPSTLVMDSLFIVLMAIMLPLLVFQTIQTLKIRRTLAQGLPLKAKRRWNRPRYWTWFAPLWCLIFVFPRLFIPDVGWEIGSLEAMALSHTWPTVFQTEALGPHPLNTEPYPDGYATENSSWPAPVQEERSTTWNIQVSAETFPIYGQYWTNVRYVQARSPKAAELVFRVELADAVKTLNNWAKQTGSSAHITDSTGFVPLDWPGVDRLEVARYRQQGLDSWTAAALRGTDILVVNYRGQAQPEDCLQLFLDALGQKEANL